MSTHGSCGSNPHSPRVKQDKPKILHNHELFKKIIHYPHELRILRTSPWTRTRLPTLVIVNFLIIKNKKFNKRKCIKSTRMLLVLVKKGNIFLINCMYGMDRCIQILGVPYWYLWTIRVCGTWDLQSGPKGI